MAGFAYLHALAFRLAIEAGLSTNTFLLLPLGGALEPYLYFSDVFLRMIESRGDRRTTPAIITNNPTYKYIVVRRFWGAMFYITVTFDFTCPGH